LNWVARIGAERLQCGGSIFAHGDFGGYEGLGDVRLRKNAGTYRWGIFLAEPEADRKIGFGDNFGQAAWQQVRVNTARLCGD